MNNKIILLYSILVLIGCNDNKSILGNVLSVDSPTLICNKSTDNIIELKHSIYIDSILGDFSKIYSIDTMLYVVDANLSVSKKLHIIDCKNNQYKGAFLNRGRSRNEVLSLSSITEGCEKGEICAYDITGQKMLLYNNIEAILENKIPDDIILFGSKKYISNPQKITNNSYIFNSIMQYKERFVIYSRENNSEQFITNDNLKFKTDEYNDVLMSDLFVRSLDVKPDKSKLVLVSRYFGLIELYNSNGELIENIIYAPHDNDLDFNISRSLERGAVIKNENTKRCFLSVKSDDSNIYILYSGRKKSDKKHYSSGDKIIVLDWDGNYISTIKTDVDLWDFTIYKKNIYAISTNSDIVRFNINGLDS